MASRYPIIVVRSCFGTIVGQGKFASCCNIGLPGPSTGTDRRYFESEAQTTPYRCVRKLSPRSMAARNVPAENVQSLKVNTTASSHFTENKIPIATAPRPYRQLYNQPPLRTVPKTLSLCLLFRIVNSGSRIQRILPSKGHSVLHYHRSLRHIRHVW